MDNAGGDAPAALDATVKRLEGERGVPLCQRSCPILLPRYEVADVNGSRGV